MRRFVSRRPISGQGRAKALNEITVSRSSEKKLILFDGEHFRLPRARLKLCPPHDLNEILRISARCWLGYRWSFRGFVILKMISNSAWVFQNGISSPSSSEASCTWGMSVFVRLQERVEIVVARKVDGQGPTGPRSRMLRGENHVSELAPAAPRASGGNFSSRRSDSFKTWL